jgi:hypothetical protein
MTAGNEINLKDCCLWPWSRLNSPRRTHLLLATWVNTQRQTAQCADCLWLSSLLVFLLHELLSFLHACEISYSAFTFAHTSVLCWDFVTASLRPSGYPTCLPVWHWEILRSAHTVIIGDPKTYIDYVSTQHELNGSLLSRQSVFIAKHDLNL